MAIATRLVDIIAILGMVMSEVAGMVVADGITTIQATFWLLYWHFKSLIDPCSQTILDCQNRCQRDFHSCLTTESPKILVSHRAASKLLVSNGLLRTKYQLDQEPIAEQVTFRLASLELS